MMNDSNSPLPTSRGPAEARSAAAGSRDVGRMPDAEVVAKAKRRQFTAAYRLRILEEVDGCQNPGEVGQLLRREGLYSSHLANWRKARREVPLRDAALYEATSADEVRSDQIL